MVKDGIYANLNLIGIQESKLFVPSPHTLKYLGGHKITKWLSLDLLILLEVSIGLDDDLFECLHHSISIFSISDVFKVRSSNLIFLFSTVYAPINRENKKVR